MRCTHGICLSKPVPSIYFESFNAPISHITIIQCMDWCTKLLARNTVCIYLLVGASNLPFFVRSLLVAQNNTTKIYKLKDLVIVGHSNTRSIASKQALHDAALELHKSVNWCCVFAVRGCIDTRDVTKTLGSSVYTSTYSSRRRLVQPLPRFQNSAVPQNTECYYSSTFPSSVMVR